MIWRRSSKRVELFTIQFFIFNNISKLPGNVRSVYPRQVTPSTYFVLDCLDRLLHFSILLPLPVWKASSNTLHNTNDVFTWFICWIYITIQTVESTIESCERLFNLLNPTNWTNQTFQIHSNGGSDSWIITSVDRTVGSYNRLIGHLDHSTGW